MLKIRWYLEQGFFVIIVICDLKIRIWSLEYNLIFVDDSGFLVGVVVFQKFVLDSILVFGCFGMFVILEINKVMFSFE